MLLVVDDEEGPRASLKVVFKNDFEVLLASNGDEAMEHARARHIDVAILDILMHGMSGVDVLRELKRVDEDIEVIMLTAYETLETARQALRLGAREYLNKPFDVGTLRQVVSRALERRRANAVLRSAHRRLLALQEELSNAALATQAASSVVQDLNNPLTVISGFVELIYRQVQSVGSLQGEELEHMRSSISRVHTQVQRCLEISRRYLGERRSAESEINRTNVNEVLADLQELLLKHPSASNNTFMVDLLPEPIFVQMHGADLLRILLNLATNALQASDRAHRVDVVPELMPDNFQPAGFGDGDAERFVGRDSLATDRRLIAISVRDNGNGMPPQVVSRVFNTPFTTKAATQGHGVGLSSVKTLVTAARGAVRLTTTVGQGSVFTVYLPTWGTPPTGPASAE